ncbi:hypothetical protein BZG36_05539 [Bifiguratus adelaidae]|uniref:GH18 domain-containing protein n=1 Tax=Bifiguratus adelaidae TaxID=1938954 RepID=A0A261XTT0_9FUNG|nr:hypothetical protein BZG36_05539 [Bifiguratus adelaidae]
MRSTISVIIMVGIALSVQLACAGPISKRATGPRVVGYYTDWSNVDPSTLPWSDYTHIQYFSAVTQPDYSLQYPETSNLDSLISNAHANGVTVSLTIGGWGQCDYCSSACNPTNRATFVNNIVAAVNKHGFDGVDIDWEYPDTSASGPSMQSSPEDTANLLATFQAIRSQLPNAILSAAVATQPFNDASGNPSTDVSGFSNTLDFISIMNYDTFGTSFIGPNSPLDNHCNLGYYPGASASAQGSVAAWTGANFPASKIVLGIPGYGYSYTAYSTSQYGSASSYASPYSKVNCPGVTKLKTGIHGPIKCGTNSTSRRRSRLAKRNGTGQIAFVDMVNNGYLQLNQTSQLYIAGPGWTRYWDSCGTAPYIFDGTSTLIAYDDTDSVWAKANWASQNVGGIMFWEMSQDDLGNGNFPLINSMNWALGRK